MKGKQGIRWSAPGQISEDRTRTMGSIVAKVVLDAVSVLIFLFSTRMILNDVFQWGQFELITGIWIAFFALTVSSIMELSYRGSTKRGYVIRGIVLGIGLILFGLYFCLGENWHVAGSGLRELWCQYIDLWNTYYGMDIYVDSGMVSNISVALDVTLTLIGFILFWIAKTFGKNILLAVLPGLALMSELLVGYSPQLVGLFLFAAGVLLANVSRWRLPEFRVFSGKPQGTGAAHSFSWIPLLLIAVLVGSLLTSAASPYAENIIANSDMIRAKIQTWIGEPKGQGSIGSGSPSIGGNDSTEEWLSNEAPVFKHVPVITVSLIESPLGNIYLKDFYAGNYDDGRWEADVNAFENYFRKKGYDPGEVTKEIAYRELNALLKAYGVLTLGQSAFNKKMEISYLTERTGRMPVPYFSEFKNSELVELVGEAYFTRTGKVDSLSATIWYYENQYAGRLDMFENEDSLLKNIGYDEYVREYYLHVPDGMDTVRSLAASLYSDKIMPRTDSENELRLHKADLVANWMEENTTYSLELPELPWRTDPIEYFLSQSKMGYCMHYASASVMLLREMGVPARLATGYVVHKGDFTKVNFGYRATVLDDQAHAWVEIYLDGLGWFPVEVTKGYRSSVPDTVPDDDPTDEETTDAPEPTDDDETLPTQEQTQGSTEEGDTEGQSTTQDGNGESTDRIDMERLMKAIRIVWAVIGVSLVVMVGILIVWKLRSNYREELRRMIRRKKTSLAIWTINRRIYRKLRLTGRIVRLNLRDDGYEEILKKSYPDISAKDWERYMTLVKAAAFSKREFSDEEVTFCYEIYRRVKPRA